jgi:hypothetical protein
MVFFKVTLVGRSLSVFPGHAVLEFVDGSGVLKVVYVRLIQDGLAAP